MFAGQGPNQEGQQPVDLNLNLPRRPMLEIVRLVPQTNGNQPGVAEFERIGSVPAQMLRDVNAQYLEVTQRDGWDVIKVKLAAPVALDINDKFGSLLDQVGSAGKLAKSLAKDAYFESEVSYRGRLHADGKVEVQDITGLSFTTSIPFVGKVKPLSAIVTPDGEVQVRAKARIFTGSKSINIPSEFVAMFGEAIREFDKLRQGS